jgi:hypothetical protein
MFAPVMTMTTLAVFFAAGIGRLFPCSFAGFSLARGTTDRIGRSNRAGSILPQLTIILNHRSSHPFVDNRIWRNARRTLPFGYCAS